RVLLKKLRRRFGQGQVCSSPLDLEEVIEVSQFPEIELKLWEVHVRAIRDYLPKPYPGRITLFRTRGQPFLCSFDPQYGWGELAEGGVDVRILPGSHEKIFLEPDLKHLAQTLECCLDQARQASAPQPEARA